MPIDNQIMFAAYNYPNTINANEIVEHTIEYHPDGTTSVEYMTADGTVVRTNTVNAEEYFDVRTTPLRSNAADVQWYHRPEPDWQYIFTGWGAASDPICPDEVSVIEEWSSANGASEDIEAECGGALDEFLDEFKPKKTTSERSDEQK